VRWGGSNGATRIYNLPCTPSDVRAAANVRSEVRRLLREDGFLVDREPAKPKPLDRMSRLEQRLAAVELELAALRNVEVKLRPQEASQRRRQNDL
jgi:hypothetical protein